MHGLSQLLLMVLYHFPHFHKQCSSLLLSKITPSTQALVSQGIYFNPAGIAETLLDAKPVWRTLCLLHLEEEGKSALQQIISCIMGPLRATLPGGSPRMPRAVLCTLTEFESNQELLVEQLLRQLCVKGRKNEDNFVVFKFSASHKRNHIQHRSCQSI